MADDVQRSMTEIIKSKPVMVDISAKTESDLLDFESVG